MPKYENSPPPSDFEYKDFPLSFTYQRPQRIIGPRFVSVDYRLIHPSFLISKNKDKVKKTIKKNTNEIGEEYAGKDIIENLYGNLERVKPLNFTENKTLILNTATSEDSIKKIPKQKKRAFEETRHASNGKEKSDVIQEGNHSSIGNKIRKHYDKSFGDCDDESNLNSISVSGLELISKSYS